MYIQRKPLIVSGNDSELMMDVMGEDMGGSSDPRRAMLQRAQEVRLLSAQVLQLRSELVEAREDASRQNQILRRLLARLCNNLLRLSNRPAFLSPRFSAVAAGGTSEPPPPQPTPQVNALDDAQGGRQENLETSSNTGSREQARESVPTATEIRAVAMERGEIMGLPFQHLQLVDRGSRPKPAKLSRCPRSLYDLWKEYEVGLGGCKAAKDFTRAERGDNRHVYSKRNHVWKLIGGMVRAGHSSDVAIDKIYDVYGHNTSVTDIIKRIIQDNKIGGHPALIDRRL